MIDETHFYKPPTPLNSNRLSYEEGVKDGIEKSINILRKQAHTLMEENKWAKADRYLKAATLIQKEANK